jgi:transposase
LLELHRPVGVTVPNGVPTSRTAPFGSSQIAVTDEGGKIAVNRNVPNGRETVLGVIGDLPVGTPVAFDAAFGWGWLIELLQDYGFEAHMAHPFQCKAIASARLKHDKVDAATLAHLLRADLLPGAWIAPPQVREQRAMLRHRAQLVRLRTLLRNRIHAVSRGLTSRFGILSGLTLCRNSSVLSSTAVCPVRPRD